MSAKYLIDMDAKQYDLLQRIIDKVIRGKAVWAYGSRVTWRAGETSDLDLVVFDCDSEEIYTLKEEFDESDLLITVDMLSWENIPESFKENIKRKYVVLQETLKLDEWRKVKLGQAPITIIDGDRGKNYPERAELFSKGYCLFLNAKNVTDKGFSFNELNFIAKEKDEVLHKGKLKKDDVVLTTRGTIGNVAFYDYKVQFKNIRINSGMVIIRPTGVDPRFNYQLFKFLKNDFFNFASGSAQPQLPIKDIRELPVLLPPLSEQKAIAEVLSSLDDKIDLLHRQNKTLEDMAHALFRKWFIEDTKEDWKKKPLDEIAEIKSGHAFRSTDFEEAGLFRLITIKNVQNGYLDMKQTSFFSKIPDRMPPYCLLSIGDVVLSLTGNVGRVSLIDKENLLLNQRVAKVVPKSQRDHPFLYFFLRNINTRRVLEEMAKGTAQANLSPIEMKNLKVPFGNVNLLKRFSDLTRPWIENFLMNRKQIDTLEQTRNTLLPKLMIGTVRVRL